MTLLLTARRRGGAAGGGATGTLPLTLSADNTGTVRYLGFIPMQPGQLSVGGASSWKVTRNDTSAELPIYTLERGRHSDGSVLGVHLQVEATNSGTDIACTLTLSGGRTQNLSSAQNISVPSINYTNWTTVAYTQGIVACTNATHLCASLLYPSLTPRDGAAVSGAPSWVAQTFSRFETLEPSYYTNYSTDDYYINTPSATSYDRPAVYVQYYLMTGEVAWLKKARRCWYKVRAGSYWTTDILDGGGRWGVPEQVNFDDTYALSYLFWNDPDGISKGLERYISDTNLCSNASYEWGIATDHTNSDVSLRKFGRYMRLFTWAHRLNLYSGTTFNGQSLSYWSQAWRDRIWVNFDGWDIGTTGRMCYRFAGVDNVGTVDTCLIFHTGIVADGLAMYSQYVNPISGSLATRYNALLDYARTQYVTLSAPDVTPRIKYVDVACYAGGGNIAVSPSGENVCLDQFLSWMWAKQGGAAATQAATAGSYVVLSPMDGLTGPYIDLSIVNGANTGQRNVSEKIFDEIFHRAFMNIGALYG